MTVRVLPGGCLRAMRLMHRFGITVQAVVCDPPYHLQSIHKRFAARGRDEMSERYAAGPYGRTARGFMGQQWDGGDIAFRPETWRAAWELLPPGGHLIAFSGTRTYHRMACAVEDAGFEIRDMVAWLYGSGFPKSHDVSKGIDKAAGAEREIVGDSPFASRKPNGSAGINSVGLSPSPGATITAPATDAARDWQGWGTALKPALEPIVLARKPPDGTVAANVLAHGTGAINVDGCRVGTGEGGDREGEPSAARRYNGNGSTNYAMQPGPRGGDAKGRWPANVIHDGSAEVVGAFPDAPGQQRPLSGHAKGRKSPNGIFGAMGPAADHDVRGDSGSAARFFYSAKATAADRHGSKHPTVKPVDVMRWLVRLVTPPGGTVLDPFAGTGTTGLACMAEGFDCILIERQAEYLADIRRRLAWAKGEGKLAWQERVEGREPGEGGPLLRMMTDG